MESWFQVVNFHNAKDRKLGLALTKEFWNRVKALADEFGVAVSGEGHPGTLSYSTDDSDWVQGGGEQRRFWPRWGEGGP